MSEPDPAADPETPAGPVAVREVTRHGPADLDPADRAAWLTLARAQEVQTPYLTPDFWELVEEVRGDQRVGVLRGEGGRPVGFFPFQDDGGGKGKPVAGGLNDFHGLLTGPGVEIDAATLLKGCGLSVWAFDHLLPHPAFAPFVERTDPSPFMDLSAGYDAYYKARRAAGSRKVKQIARMGRKFDREDGPVTFDPDCRDEATLDRLIGWKRSQYAATGVWDLFQLGWPRDLLVRLLAVTDGPLVGRMGVLLRKGDPVAADLGMHTGRVLHSWFAAYDDAFSDHGPGHQCSLNMAERANGLGVFRIELGKGPESYKQSLASGNRDVCEGAVDLRLTAPLARVARAGYRKAKDLPIGGPVRRVARRVKGMARGATGF